MEIYTNVDKNISNAIVYGIDHSSIDYFRNKYDILKNSMVQNNVQNTSHQAIYDNVAYINSERYISDVKQQLFEMGAHGNDETNIYYYKNPTEANIATLEYIMANPVIQDLYDRGIIEGYSNRYNHNQTDSEIRYKSVMNGELHSGDKFVTYFEPGLIKMSNTDKDIIKSNWERCLYQLRSDIDPTAM